MGEFTKRRNALSGTCNRKVIRIDIERASRFGSHLPLRVTLMNLQFLLESGRPEGVFHWRLLLIRVSAGLIFRRRPTQKLRFYSLTKTSCRFT